MLPLAFGLLAALALPAAAQRAPYASKNGAGKALFAKRAQAVSVAPKHVSVGSKYVSVGSKHGTYGKPSFGVSYSKPGFQIGFGTNGGFVSAGYSNVCAPQKVWIAGHWTTVRERVWIPASCAQVWVEPVYATNYDNCGKAYQVLVQAGHYQTVNTPGHFEVQVVNKWVDGYWKYS